MDSKELYRIALSQLNKAYAPYSKFHVGAALLAKDGRIFTGVNVENASYGATVCAERTAFFKAISEGEREFDAIAIVAGKEGEALSKNCTPCGVCRQVMTEFCDSDFKIILGTPEDFKVYTLDEIIPLRFNKTEL